MKNGPLRYKKLDARASAPTRGSKDAAGADLRAVLDEPATLAPGETRLLWLADTGAIVRGASAAVGAVGAPVMDLNGKEKYP